MKAKGSNSKYILKEQIAAIRTAYLMHPILLDAFNILELTGIRISELYLFVNQVIKNPSASGVFVQPSKDNEKRFIPTKKLNEVHNINWLALKNKLDEMYERAKKSERKFLQNLSYFVCEQIPVIIDSNRFKFSPHDLRKTFICKCHDYGIDSAYIQKIVGHRSIQATLKYLNINTESCGWIFDLTNGNSFDAINQLGWKQHCLNKEQETYLLRERNSELENEIKKLKENK